MSVIAIFFLFHSFLKCYRYSSSHFLPRVILNPLCLQKALSKAFHNNKKFRHSITGVISPVPLYKRVCGTFTTPPPS